MSGEPVMTRDFWVDNLAHLIAYRRAGTGRGVHPTPKDMQDASGFVEDITTALSSSVENKVLAVLRKQKAEAKDDPDLQIALALRQEDVRQAIKEAFFQPDFRTSIQLRDNLLRAALGYIRHSPFGEYCHPSERICNCGAPWITRQIEQLLGIAGAFKTEPEWRTK